MPNFSSHEVPRQAGRVAFGHRALASGLLGIGKRLYHKVFLAPRGYGRPVDKKSWETQYKNGYWEYLYDIDEVAHYAVIAAYATQRFESPSILDVGCGHGRLLKMLAPHGFNGYVGIDLSTEAIDRAKSLHIENARFVAADFERRPMSGKFNTIIFNESLYYARKPADVLASYSSCLNKDGVVIVSMFSKGNAGSIWKSLKAGFTTVDSTTVINNNNKAWDIKVLQPKR